MIVVIYVISGVLLLVSGVLFKVGVFDGIMQIIVWIVVFFFVLVVVSLVYLIVSEIFLFEVCVLVIVLFYVVGMGFGGVVGLVLFGWLIDMYLCDVVFGGYVFGVVLMLLVVVVQVCWGMVVECKFLEYVVVLLLVDDSLV